MLREISTILADPVTKESLKLIQEKFVGNHVTEGKLISSANEYEIKEGIADLIPKKEDLKINSNVLITWEDLQKNGKEVYEKFPKFNCSVASRTETQLYKKFCSFHGKVLDVGCGPSVPGYLQNNENIDFAIGIDPLIPNRVEKLYENIDLMRALAEFLPFKDKTFDIVSFATSFDHVIEPEIVLKESIRVLKNDGIISFWIEDDPKQKSILERAVNKGKRILFSTMSKEARIETMDVKKQEEIIRSMKIPPGAIDVFHLRNYHYSKFDYLCQTFNLTKISEERVDSVKSVFVKYKLK